EGEDAEAPAPGRPAAGPANEPTAADVAELNRKLDQVTLERDQLRQDRDRVLSRLVIRVLEIDPDSGGLYYYDPERAPVATEADAQALIDRERRRVGGRELYFLILYPRATSGY